MHGSSWLSEIGGKGIGAVSELDSGQTDSWRKAGSAVYLRNSVNIRVNLLRGDLRSSLFLWKCECISLFQGSKSRVQYLLDLSWLICSTDHSEDVRKDIKKGVERA